MVCRDRCLPFSTVLRSTTGIPVTKPQEVKGLLALGGPEESSGYKGYGLAMMVEILCGILSGIALPFDARP